MAIRDRPWFRQVLMFSTALWLVLGAGLWAHLESMPSPLPESLVLLGTVVSPEGDSNVWFEASRKIRGDQETVRQELKRADAFLSSFNAQLKPLLLQLNYKEPRRYLVTSRRIELGSEIASSPGQVRHAVYKAWMLQNGRPRFTIPLFRQDLVADLLLAINDNGLSLGVPGTDRELVYTGTEAKTFFERLSTLEKTCGSDWRPNDLYRLCSSMENETYPIAKQVSPFSMRQPVGQAIWNSIEGLGAFERLEFARHWTTFLTKAGSSDESDDSPAPPEGASLWAWHQWARGELEALLPTDNAQIGFSPKIGRTITEAREAAAASAGLDQKQDLAVDLIVRFETPESKEDFAKSSFKPLNGVSPAAVKTAVIEHEGQRLLYPGEVVLSDADFPRIRAKALIWESCETPRVDQLIKYPLRTDRVLVVRHCAVLKKKPNYRTYARYGAEGFALDNPEILFLQAHRPSLEFASEQKLIPSSDFLKKLFAPPTPSVDRKLGLNEASWNTQFKAYRVLGAIEAIEWFRPESSAKN